MAAHLDLAAYMREAIEEARKAPAKPTNYCVGAVLVDMDLYEVIATGYTMEIPGNTHAEQCCLQKYAETRGLTADKPLADILPPNVALFTTMEPCIERQSGNLPCVDRILQARTGGHGVQIVYSGIREPDTFVKKNAGKAKLEAAGIQCSYVPGFEDEILAIAIAGHSKID